MSHDHFISCLHHEKMLTASKLQNKRHNIKIWQNILVHIVFKLFSVYMNLQSLNLVECCVVIESVNMWIVTIVTGGITVNLGLHINPIVVVVNEKCTKMLQSPNIALNKKFKCYK